MSENGSNTPTPVGSTAVAEHITKENPVYVLGGGPAGLTAGYDECLVKGDAVMAAAVWRNVCKGDEGVDLVRLAEIVSYMRSVLYAFDGMEDDVIARGDIVFGDPGSEEAWVKVRSKMLDDELDEEGRVLPATLQKAPAKPREPRPAQA